MPCAVCDHTLQNVGAEGRRVYWCPRCGSLKIETGDFGDTQAPALVGRVRSVAGNAKECLLDREPSFAVARRDWMTLCESIAIGEDLSV